MILNKKKKVNHKQLQIEGTQIHYYVSGGSNDPCILFIHPAFSDHKAFEQQLSFFSKKHKVITIDLIGHGLSKANKSKDKIDDSTEHILQILGQEKVNRLHLVGVSIGALVAQYFAFKYPERVQSLVALGGYNIHVNNKEVEKAQRGVNLGLIFRAILSMKSFRKKVASMTCSSKKGQDLFYETTLHFQRKSFMVMQGLQNIIKDRDNIVINYPTLVLVGDEDIPLAKKMAKQWHRELENSEYNEITGAGHCANIDQPLQFNQRIESFFSRHEDDLGG